MTDTEYNGWTNYETWNVALWIDNDQGLQITAKECGSYDAFVENMREFAECCKESTIGIETPDGVAWNDSGINRAEIDAMIAEIGE